MSEISSHIMSPHVALSVTLIMSLASTPHLFPARTPVSISFPLMTLCVFPEHLANGPQILITALCTNSLITAVLRRNECINQIF